MTDDGAAGGETQDAAALDYNAEDLYENAPCGYLSYYPDGRIARVNETFLGWTGYRRSDLVGRRFVDLLTAGGRIYHETHYAPLLRMQGSVRSIALDLVRADGTRLPVLVNSRMRTDDAGRPLAVWTSVFDATDRKQYETELLAARHRAEQSSARLRVVEQVVADLAAVSGVAEVSDVIARAGSLVFGAAASSVWLTDHQAGAYVLATVAGAGGAGAARAATVPALHDAALRAGEVVVVPGAAAESLVPEVHAVLGSAPGGLLLTPLNALDRTLGLLALRLVGEEAPETEELSLLRTLGRQAGQALERARLFDEQSRVATTLQHSLLPRTLPDDPRVSLSACYRPAVDGLEVGGDWYDAFLLDDDRVAIVVGDVVGRGLHAAAVMGQLRSAVRALATVDSGPAQLLQGLDRFVEGVHAADTATMAYAEVDLRNGVVRFACAGHPPPVYVDPAGRAALLWEGRSAPLGAHFGVATRPEARLTMVPGARLVMYTDGLVERRDQPLDQCIAALAEELGAWSDRPFDTLADGVTDAILGGDPTDDDVCLLALSFQERPTFVRSVAAEASRVTALRADLTRWLQTHGVTGEDHDAALLACSEAVSNAIEHGYPADTAGVVHVVATVTPGLLRLRVRDTGHWRQPRPPGDRGRGLLLIRQLMDQVVIDRSAGTIVMMQRTLTAGARP
ncbi:MAG: SpoIIE family protein phosphatase [Actinomycetes bacterium]